LGDLEHRVMEFLWANGPATADAVRDIIRKFCRGSLEELLIGMVDQRVVGSSQLRRLAEKVDQRERERKKS
jgi:predicted transcriptional regulator